MLVAGFVVTHLVPQGRSRLWTTSGVGRDSSSCGPMSTAGLGHHVLGSPARLIVLTLCILSACRATIAMQVSREDNCRG
jgi:hypothetical protein